jgi:hypothetical protein
MPNIEIDMKYSRNRHYRDQEMIIEKEIITLGKKIKKNNKRKKIKIFEKIINFFKG